MALIRSVGLLVATRALSQLGTEKARAVQALANVDPVRLHGRIESRRVAVSTDLDWLAEKQQWAGLKAVAMVESTREIRNKVSVERRYYLSSISDPQRIATAIRQHWLIENQQHWVLDVQFGEDARRARKNHSAANLGIIRRAPLNMLRANDDSPISMKRRKMRASYNQVYRERILFGSLRTT